MRVVLVSTYELGHQPLHVASPAAALRSAGHEVRCLDLAVERWDPQWLEWGEAVAFSVPMHTAMRLALRAAEALRSQQPELPLCLYGLYAPVSRDLTVGRLVDSVIAGEYEPALVAWVGGLARAERSDSPGAEVVHLGRQRFKLPARELLPPLERYARLVLGDEELLVGYVEASHGCVHRCRHCPVPTVYDGRIRIVHEDVLLRAGHLEVLAVFDKPDPLEGPYFEETIYVTPSRLPAEALQRIERLTQATADALGLREGPVHAELRLDGDRAWVVELAARSIGGLCSRALRFGTGATLEEVILRHALGLPLPDLHREAAASGVMMLPIERAGVLTGVGGRDEALAVSGITDLQITVPPDREVVPLPEGDRYLGFIFARGDDPAAVEAALREAHARLEVDIRAPAAAAVR